MAARGEQESLPTRRVVLLGASNLAQALPAVLTEARAAWGAPLDFLAALGHGRSYGMPSRMLGRSLCGILTCGLWEALARRWPADTAAVVTDVGNDLLYGAPPDQTAAWVEECVSRLRAVSAAMVVTELPLASLSRLSRWRFLFLRTLFFPACRLSYEEGMKRARQLNRLVQQLAQRHGAQLITPRASWYGWDPIHIRRSARRPAWNEICARWSCERRQAATGLSVGDRFGLCGLRPEQRRLFGIEQRRVQPARTLSGGTLVSLY